MGMLLDSQIVRGALILYCLIAIFSVVLLWQNAAASDSLKNAGIVLASILPVLISILPYINAVKLEKKFTFILLYDSKLSQITTGNNNNNPYIAGYREMFTNLTNHPDSLSSKEPQEFMGNKGLNLIEKGILQSLILEFPLQWDFIPNHYRFPGATSLECDRGENLQVEKINLSELKMIFKHNQLIQYDDVICGNDICLPPKSMLKAEANEQNKSRTIIINNPFLALTIKVLWTASMPLQQGLWGILEDATTDIKRFHVIVFRVSITAKLNSFKVYSPEMASYKRWFENICDTLSGYDWQNIEKKTQEKLTQDAILKILKGKE